MCIALVDALIDAHVDANNPLAPPMVRCISVSCMLVIQNIELRWHALQAYWMLCFEYFGS